jgi:hypothetical protein
MFCQIQMIELVPHADRQLVAHVNASPSLSSFLMHHKVPASGFLGHRTVNSVAFTMSIGTTGSDSIRSGHLLVGDDALQMRGSPWVCIYRSMIDLSTCRSVYRFMYYSIFIDICQIQVDAACTHNHSRTHARTHARTRAHTHMYYRWIRLQPVSTRTSERSYGFVLAIALPS